MSLTLREGLKLFWESYDFWRDSMLGVILAAALCGWLGVYVVLRRVVFVGAALTQVSGVGVAFAFWVASFFAGSAADPHTAEVAWWLSPQLYSLGFAILGALLFARSRGNRRLASETIVGLGWVIAAAGLLLILSSKRIVAEAHEVDDLLYGSAVIVTTAQVKTLFAVLVAIIGFHVMAFKELLFVTYDTDMAQTLGVKTGLWDMLLFATFGVGISFAVRTVGALPAFAFLIIPAAAALLLVKRALWAFPLAVAFAVLGGILGYMMAFVKEYPTGASIVAMCAIFLVPGIIRSLLRRD